MKLNTIGVHNAFLDLLTDLINNVEDKCKTFSIKTQMKLFGQCKTENNNVVKCV